MSDEKWFHLKMSLWILLVFFVICLMLSQKMRLDLCAAVVLNTQTIFKQKPQHWKASCYYLCFFPRYPHSHAGTHQAVTHLTLSTDTLHLRAQARPSLPSGASTRWPAGAAWKRQTQHLRRQLQHCGLLQTGDVCLQGEHSWGWVSVWTLWG